MIRISLADDHEIFLQGLKLLLGSKENFEVITTNSEGMGACEVICEHQPDVAVIDYSMPGMNGIEIAQQIHDDKLKTKVILLTMHCSTTYVLEAQQAGIAGYILKETAFEKLSQAIEAVYHGNSFYPDELLEKMEPDVDLPLSQQERLVLTAVAEGRTSKQIAKLLNIKPKTVETYRSRITEKLDLHSIADMTRYALRMGLVN